MTNSGIPGVQVLHGPHLKTERPRKGQKRTPGRWQIGLKVNGITLDQIDHIARKENITRSDVVRIALVELIKKCEYLYTLNDGPSPVTDQPATSAPLQPAQATRYTGRGGSDHRAITAVTGRAKAAHASGQAKERLRD